MGSSQRKNEKRNDKIENNETLTRAISNKGFSGNLSILLTQKFVMVDS